MTSIMTHFELQNASRDNEMTPSQQTEEQRRDITQRADECVCIV